MAKKNLPVKAKRKRPAAPAVSRQEVQPVEERHFPIVGVGASAGGFEAFTEMLRALPADSGMAFVFIQHLEPRHKSMLARLLSRETRMPVVEAADGMVLEPDHVYVIPANADMAVSGGILQLTGRRTTEGRHLPVDHFLQSLAEDQGGRAVGVVLSGTASDGTLGLKAIKAEGGITFAQDDQSAKHSGMPRSAVSAGCVDFVLPPEKIASELVRIARYPHVRVPEKAPPLEPSGEDGLQTVLTLLRKAGGVDFSHYKSPTLRRRIARRMVLHKIGTLNDYIQYLRSNHTEVEALYEDILIHVTSFFRESPVFERLRTKILPKIMQAKSPGESVRVWVPGCSTGEEPYSIAITLLEYLSDQGAGNTPIQIFGTDISESAIERARAGIYSESSMADVSLARRRRFFHKVAGGYQINKSIREMCVFAKQDLTRDPPFSKLDLISCRNVLIYMEPVLQKRIMAVFHYALRDTGCLMLGKSETLGAYFDLFAPVDRKGRFYVKRLNAGQPALNFAANGYEADRLAPIPKKEAEPSFDVQREADRLVWNRYAHAGLIIKDDLEILHFRGDTSPYLRPVPGKASLNLLKMVREDLLLELRTAVHKARKDKTAIRKEGIRLGDGDHLRQVNVEVLPLGKPEKKDRHYLVLFDELPLRTTSKAGPRETIATTRGKQAGDREAARLKQELTATKEYLQTIIEEQEATNEELKSANEEILSSNEELQSTNEELETAKEELQSTNEELITLNEQLQKRNDELSRLSDDLANVLTGVNIPILMLGKDQRIRRFTPMAEKLLNLLPTDVGRPIGNIRPNIDVPNLERLISEVTDTLVEQEREVQERDGHWFSVRIRPYRTSDNKIDGALIIFQDIDALKQSLNAAEEARRYAESIVEMAREPLAVLDSDLRVVTANRSFYDTFRTSKAETENRLLYELGNRQWNIPALKHVLEKILPQDAQLENFEVHHEFPKIGRRTVTLNARQIRGDDEPAPKMILLAMEDITERKRAEDEADNALRLSQQQLRALTANLLTVQEEERERISRELHDDLNQRLAMLTVEIEALEQRLPSSEELWRGQLRSLRDRTAAISDDVRRTAYQLHPSTLDHLGLAVALKQLSGDFSRQERLRVMFRERNLPQVIPAEVALCLYRVTQEALRNVARHSGARRASVVLAGTEEAVQLSVSDTGVGFDIELVKGKGLGIVNMEERVRLLMGTLFIKTRPGGGTRVIVQIPLPKESS
jgi:two-component system CheB/CheR fusion protein